MTDKSFILTVTRAQQGDTRAFDVLVKQFQNTAVAYARNLLHDPAAAEDAAQEAFVQAWRDLPSLTEAAAFRAWLRRIVFKFCDRARRSAHATLPLSNALPLPESLEPASIAERADRAAEVHAAINKLSCPLREVTLLYYLTGHDVKEISSFLEVPPSTVKNRLHAARKHLRKELWTMAEIVLDNEKPSQSDTFSGSVLARVLLEFKQQEKADPHAVNRGLLEEGQIALTEMLRSGTPLDAQSVRDGFILLWRKCDMTALAALLMRYLSQPLSDSETAWAYLHLANALAISGSPAGAVLTFEASEHWMPGKAPCLAARWPYWPDPEDVPGAIYVGEEVRLLFLTQSMEFAKSYSSVWRSDEYLAKVDAALATASVTESRRKLHSSALRMASAACEAVGDFDRAKQYIQQIHVLAAGAEDKTLGIELEAEALGQEIYLSHLKRDETAFTAHRTALMALLDRVEQSVSANVRWLRSERHNLACVLVWAGRHTSALPLWEANAASGGQVNGGGWFFHAATVWQLTQDRERTLTLLREARVHEDRDAIPAFVKCPEFADVKDDAEFLQAIGRESHT